jgi:hypothetical protein
MSELGKTGSEIPNPQLESKVALEKRDCAVQGIIGAKTAMLENSQTYQFAANIAPTSVSRSSLEYLVTAASERDSLRARIAQLEESLELVCADYQRALDRAIEVTGKDIATISVRDHFYPPALRQGGK